MFTFSTLEDVESRTQARAIADLCKSVFRTGQSSP